MKLKDKLKAKFGKSPDPRQMLDIQQEYNEVIRRAGAARYQVYVFEKDLDQLNARLLRLNQEGAARQQLDAENSKKEQSSAPKEEVKSEQA